MTKTYGPFDSGAGATVYESFWTQMMRNPLTSGVIKGVLNELQVYADSSGMKVKVKSGHGWVVGHYFISDAEEEQAIAAADGANPRIDRVILRVDWTANTLDLAVLTGTPAVSPAVPALTQNTSKWEVELAQVAVGAGVATITAANVTDSRTLVGPNIDIVLTLTNKSGGQVVLGDVVIQDTANNDAFTTTTSAGDAKVLGIVLETIANNAAGKILIMGIARVNGSAATAKGNWLATHTVAKQAAPAASRGAGSFAIALQASGGAGLVECLVLGPAGGAGMVNPMTTQGDLIKGGASGAPTRQALGAALALLRVNSGGTDIEFGSPGQVAFPASQNPSADVNVLDDYEEGTFTPNVGGSATYTTQTGHYVKIGLAVFFRFHLTINAIGSSIGYLVYGLPFTCIATYSFGVYCGYFSSLARSSTWVSGYVNQNGAFVELVNTAAAVASVTDSGGLLGNSSNIYISGWYEAQ